MKMLSSFDAQNRDSQTLSLAEMSNKLPANGKSQLEGACNIENSKKKVQVANISVGNEGSLNKFNPEETMVGPKHKPGKADLTKLFVVKGLKRLAIIKELAINSIVDSNHGLDASKLESLAFAMGISDDQEKKRTRSK